MTFNAHAPENTYSLEMAFMWVHHAYPQSVRLCTTDPDIAVACARRLDWLRGPLTVDNQTIANALRQRLNRDVVVHKDNQAVDVAVLPFSRKDYDKPPNANTVVMVGYNALSYKSLTTGFKVEDNVFGMMNWLRQTHTLSQRVGLMTPDFIAKWAVSLAAGARYPGTHFRVSQHAMDHIYRRGPLWLTGYIVVMAGHKNGGAA